MNDNAAIESALQRITELEIELQELRVLLEKKLGEPGETFSEPAEQEEPDEGTDSEPDTPFHLLMKETAELRTRLRQGDFPVFESMTAFAEKTSQIAAGISSEEGASGKASKIVFDLIGFYDRISSLYFTDGFRALRSEIQKAIASCRAFLESNSFTVVPSENAEGEVFNETVHEGKTIPVYSGAPEGTILAVAGHGIRSDEGGDKQPVYIVSRFTENSVLRFPLKCLEIMITYSFKSGETGKPPADAGKIRTWIESLPKEEHPEETALIYLRQILNMFSQIQKKPKIVKKIIGSILDLLKENGFSQIPVSVGVMFDSSFSTSKYERKYIESDKGKDTIVSIIQYGLIDSSGIPVQKSIVGVSRG